MNKKMITTALLGAALLATPLLGSANENAMDETTLLDSAYGWTMNNYEQSGTEYFADSAYMLRQYGYDWVGVEVTHPAADRIHVLVRSRKDIKKETCHYELDAKKVAPNVYLGYLNGKPIEVSYYFTGIQIEPKNEEAKKELFFVCSGGAYGGGIFGRLAEPLAD